MLEKGGENKKSVEEQTEHQGASKRRGRRSTVEQISTRQLVKDPRCYRHIFLKKVQSMETPHWSKGKV